MEMNNLSERAREDFELICKALEEDNQFAYSQLLERYRDKIFHTMYKMVKNTEDADDLTIETFGKAFHKLASYTPNFAFSTWLFRIATNNCIDFIRKQKMQTLSIDEPVNKNGELSFMFSMESNFLNPEDKVIQQQKSKILKSLLGRLNEKYRLMLEYRYFDELSYQEISEKMDLPLGTVKVQLFRAKEQLSELIKSDKSGISKI
jgi:RNA polymerase sigma factor (sigma-70 family)